MQKFKNILWVDDDGRDHFLYELSVLAEQGVLVDFALDAAEAIAKLQANEYDLVIFDQHFPIVTVFNSQYGVSTSQGQDLWSGCRLLYWLRGEPFAEVQGQADWSAIFCDRRPLPSNRNTPVIFISGFQDDHVDKALGRVSPEIDCFPKPVDVAILTEIMARLLRKEDE